MLKISIIVPVYNVEKYLERCLESLVNQTCTAYEIITVDDGSSDKSGQICDEYAQKFTFIKSLHKENGGLSSARNYGINEAEGDWIAFVDSDDWIEGDFIEKCEVALSKYGNCDSISYGYFIDYTDNAYSLDRKYQNTSIFHRGNVPDAIEIMEKDGMFNSVCNKLYSNSLLQKGKIRFTEKMEPGEDLIFNCEYFKHVDSCILLTNQFYHYMRQGENTLTKKHDPRLAEKIELFHQSRVKLYGFWEMKEERFQKELLRYYFYYIMSAIYNNYSTNSSMTQTDRIQFLREVFENQNLKEYMNTYGKDEETVYSKVFSFLYANQNAVMADATYTILFWARNHLKGLYNHFRKRQLIN